MHEEATTMSVPSSVAISTSHNQNGTVTSVTVPVVTEVDLDSIHRENSLTDNVDLQVSYSSSSAGT